MNKTYTTTQGDTWDSIAYQQMGSVNGTHDLMWANRAYLGYYTFPAGITLTIPEVEAAVSATAPPWKKASK